MSNPEIGAAVVAERREQVALYSSLAEPQWDAATLCEGWRVREVLAHTTMPFRYSLPRVVVEMVKARGRFDRMADRRARIDAQQLSTAQLLASLRDNIEHPCAARRRAARGAVARRDPRPGRVHAPRAGLPCLSATGRPGAGRPAAEEHRLLRRRPRR